MKSKKQVDATVRVSVTFSADTYKSLEQIADKKKVSVAWVVRDAADGYIAAQRPRPPTKKN